MADVIMFESGDGRLRVHPGTRIRLLSDGRDRVIQTLENGTVVSAANFVLEEYMEGTVIGCLRSSQTEPRRLVVDFPGFGAQIIHEGEVDFEICKE